MVKNTVQSPLGDTLDSLTDAIMTKKAETARNTNGHHGRFHISDSDERNNLNQSSQNAILIDSSSIEGSAGGFTKAFNNTTFNLDNTSSAKNAKDLHQ